MEKPKSAKRSSSQELIKLLKAHFEYCWVTDDEQNRWELRFLFQLIEFEKPRSRINVAMVANRNGDARDLQHAAYLELNCDDSRLTLRWSSGVNYAVEDAIVAFKNIYPLERLVDDIQRALRGYSIDVLIPEIERQVAKVSKTQTGR